MIKVDSKNEKEMVEIKGDVLSLAADLMITAKALKNSNTEHLANDVIVGLVASAIYEDKDTITQAMERSNTPEIIRERILGIVSIINDFNGEPKN